MKNKILFLFLFILFFTNLNKSFSFDSDVYFKNTNTEKIIQDFVKNKELTNTDIYKLSKSVYELYDSWNETYKTNFFENVKCTTKYYIAAPSKKDIERNEKECLTKLTLNTIDKNKQEIFQDKTQNRDLYKDEAIKSFNKEKEERDSYSIKIVEKILSLNKVFTFDKNNKDINIGKNNDIILSLNGINLEKDIYKSKKDGKKNISRYVPDFKIIDNSGNKIGYNKYDFTLSFTDKTRTTNSDRISIQNKIYFLDKKNNIQEKIDENIYNEYKKTKKIKIIINFSSTDWLFTH